MRSKKRFCCLQKIDLTLSQNALSLRLIPIKISEIDSFSTVHEALLLSQGR